MINEKLINPRSIVVVGGSEDTSKTGGKVLKNLLDGQFAGKLYVVNPKSDTVQGIASFRDVTMLPGCDLAILAIPAKACLPAVEVLVKEKNVKAFIILSAGFGEESEVGKILEKKISDTITSAGGTLLGPNCIGLMNTNYCGVFTTPLPKLSPNGAELISGSGATAVFIMEMAIPKGLPFSGVYSVGNSVQTGVEDILEYLDSTYVEGRSSKVKLLYIESLRDPLKLLRHAASLISKGCHIAAIKAGSSEAGSRAASSHTGAMASSDMAYDAIFHKSGIVRCNSRSELVAVASVFMNKLPAGKHVGIITHAGGPAVMLTDTLSKSEIEVPQLSGDKASELKNKLYPGSSVSNPVDFLATGTASQLETIINTCDSDFDNIDAMAVIFGSPGLFPVNDVYNVIHEKIRSCRKPVYPILPSEINAQKEIEEFVAKGNIYFQDEVVFGHALSSVLNRPLPVKDKVEDYNIDRQKIRSVIDSSPAGYINPVFADALLEAAGISVAPSEYVKTKDELSAAVEVIGFPIVMKAIGPLHKSDTGGVMVNINDIETTERAFRKLSAIKECKMVLVQKMIKGTELFAGLTFEENFGHILLAGLGGIFVEVMKDFSFCLVPVTEQEALNMIRSLKGYKIFQGIRGREGINEKIFAEIICRLSVLATVAPEITEMDINPLIGSGNSLTAADVRIKIKK